MTHEFNHGDPQWKMNRIKARPATHAQICSPTKAAQLSERMKQLPDNLPVNG